MTSLNTEFQWIEHDGTDCPLPMGTRLEIRRFSGQVEIYVISNMDHYPDPFVLPSAGLIIFNGWFWASYPVPEELRFGCVRAYRLIVKSEDEKAEDRTAMFRSWIAPPVVTPKPVHINTRAKTGP